MATTKLQLYKGALVELGERTISSLTEDRKSRRTLDVVWDNGFVDEVLQKGQWNFAARSALIDYDTSVDPPFGYSRAFAKPDDWIRTLALSAEEYFIDPLRNYEDEAGYWYAEEDELYVKWVSNDANYGGDLSSWPVNFSRFVEVYLASRVSTALSQNKGLTRDLIGFSDRLLIRAKSTDAMDEAAKTMPRGTWSRSRHGNSADRERRGS